MRHQRSYPTEAIVLKHMDLGEADRILTLFTPHKGKVHVIAKGTRRPISKLAGHLDLLNRSQLQLALGRNLDIVTQAEGRENFLHLRTDLWHMTCGFYLAELVDRFIEEHTQHANLYHLLLETLRYLDADALALQAQRSQGIVATEDEHRRSKLLLRYLNSTCSSMLATSLPCKTVHIVPANYGQKSMVSNPPSAGCSARSAPASGSVRCRSRG